MATAHINAAPGDFASTVLMPGDPLRAKYIAEAFLTDARCVTDVRNMLGYTGSYKNRQVSVMAHGMGIPSASIYTYELITAYDVRRLIRVGSCGTTHPDVRLRDLVIAMGASTDSSVNRMRFGGHDLAALASFELVEKAVTAASQAGARHHVGNVFSADLFYPPDTAMFETLAKYNVFALEMEAAGIFPIAAENNAEALAICTVSEDISNNKQLSVEDRATTFGTMIKIALETAVAECCDAR